jgi:mono/diheme cytochrome c family protein
MHITRRKLTRAVGLGTLVLLGTAAASVRAQDYDAALADMKQHWGTLETYCTTCHNFEDYAGGLDFTLLSPEEIVQNADTFELVLKKLRASVMPPPSQDQPSQDERWQLVAAMERTLDAWAAQHPDPGRVGLHRLNRTEYVNAIRDMTGVELNTELSLPKDDNSDGFDNIASVLKVSPSFLDQYIASARVVAERAVGDPAPRAETAFYPADSSHQGAHVHGLPLGTRGGALIEHEFPVDGEYTITIPGMAGAGYTLGMEYEHDVVVTLDGKPIFRRSIGGGDDLKQLDQIQAPAVAEINARFANIPITVSSGKHKIGVAFVARSFAEGDEFLHDLGVNRGMDRIARMRGVQVNGPISTSGHINTASRQKVMICEPSALEQEIDCARQIFSNLAKQAFRRPITDEDIQKSMEFFDVGRQQGSFDAGIKNGMMAILTSPKFLVRAELPEGDVGPGDIIEISELELASRLSFFLWSSLPDDELVDLATRGELRKGDNLDQQIARMLADPRSEALVENFVFQWLRLRDLENIDPDPEIFANFRPALMEAFKEEVRLFATDVIRSDAPVHELMTSEYTYLNEDLALHYGMHDVKGDHFRKVRLNQIERSGLLGKGAVQMVTSYANRTTPVIRGAYVMENFLGVPPANPPPNVEAFPETPEGATVAETVRERLEKHRDNPACAGCHDIMDPLGLALENFNAIGEFRLRDSDAGNALIDASGQLADGTPLAGVNDLRAALVDRPDQFAHVFTEKLMMYAMGRGVEAHDMPAVRAIVHGAEKDEFRISAIIKGVIASDQFQKMSVPTENLEVGSVDTATGR